MYKIKGTDVVPHVRLAQVRVLFTWCLWAVSVLAFLFIFTQYLFSQQCRQTSRASRCQIPTFSSDQYIFDYKENLRSHWQLVLLGFLHMLAVVEERALMCDVNGPCDVRNYGFILWNEYCMHATLCGERHFAHGQSLQKCHNHPEAFNQLPEWISGDLYFSEDKTLFSGSLGMSWKWFSSLHVFIKNFTLPLDVKVFLTPLNWRARVIKVSDGRSGVSNHSSQSVMILLKLLWNWKKNAFLFSVLVLYFSTLCPRTATPENEANHKLPSVQHGITNVDVFMFFS